ncbi:MAG: metallophosphoesterase [Desulfobulbaceae bacterium]|nr:metallophosphoesterase [Desulfobulbaceae bacterium]
MMVKFIQLSDLHIHKGMRESENVCAKKIIAYIINRYDSAEKPVVLITGDIVDDGKRKQYENAVKILKPLVESGFEVLAVPGNHDHGRFGNIYSKRSRNYFRKYILGQLLSVPIATDTSVNYSNMFPLKNTVNDVLFIGVDSSIGNFFDELTHFASGEVGEVQRDRISGILGKDEYADMKKIIYFHHHPFIRNYTMEMDDAKEVMQLLAGNIDICCFGHKHISDVWSSQNSIDWTMASGKSTERNSNYKFQYREVTMNGDDNEVTMVTFKAD